MNENRKIKYECKMFRKKCSAKTHKIIKTMEGMKVLELLFMALNILRFSSLIRMCILRFYKGSNTIDWGYITWYFIECASTWTLHGPSFDNENNLLKVARDQCSFVLLLILYIIPIHLRIFEQWERSYWEKEQLILHGSNFFIYYFEKISSHISYLPCV